MSRTGNPREILRGPLYYGIAFIILTIVFWKDSPVGMTALMICGGDGLADLVGRSIAEIAMERRQISGRVVQRPRRRLADGRLHPVPLRFGGCFQQVVQQLSGTAWHCCLGWRTGRIAAAQGRG